MRSAAVIPNMETMPWTSCTPHTIKLRNAIPFCESSVAFWIDAQPHAQYRSARPLLGAKARNHGIPLKASTGAWYIEHLTYTDYRGSKLRLGVMDAPNFQIGEI